MLESLLYIRNHHRIEIEEFSDDTAPIPPILYLLPLNGEFTLGEF